MKHGLVARATSRQAGAEGFDAGVDEEADVADGGPGDLGDLLVGEVVAELEEEGLALVFGEVGEHAEDLGGGVGVLGGGGGVGGGGGYACGGVVGDEAHAALLAFDVECGPAADGVEPSGLVAGD